MPHSDPEKRRAYHRAYYEAHKPELVARAAVWQQEHREQFNATHRAMYERNGDSERARSRARWRDNADAVRDTHLRRKYGISIAEYNGLVRSQCGSCAICGRVPSEEVDASATVRRLVVDHDHKTNRIRGLICHKCNRALGLFGDDPEVVAKAAEYIR